MSYKLCECGCGGKIIIKSHHKYYGTPKYIHGHNTRVDNPMKNSNIAEKSAISRIGSKRTDEVKREKSEAMIKYHREYPEMGKKQSEFMSNNTPMKNPETAKKQGESMKNSDAAKTEAERQRGGTDIIYHHYIYDHNDISKYTMPMTRSVHAKLHAIFRKFNIEIPHINIRGN